MSPERPRHRPIPTDREFIQLDPEYQRRMEVAERIQSFRTFIRDDVGYSLQDQRYIDRGINICLTHEYNDQADKRSRRFDHTPYIYHPLAMAREAARMRLHPTIVLACLLHDVPEDVRYGGVETADLWIKQITRAFEKYPDRGRLIRILRAELKTESLQSKIPDTTERNEVTKYYLETPLGKTALRYLDDLREVPNGSVNGRIETMMDHEAIAEVIFDLNRIMTESFKDADGNSSDFDPAILVVKILDTWQNLQTSGFWKNQLSSGQGKDAKTIAKLIRARVLTNIAEFLGMRRIASDMTQNIALIQNIDNIDAPALRKVSESSGESDSQHPDELAQRASMVRSRLIRAKQIADLVRKIFLGKSSEDQLDITLQLPWGSVRGYVGIQRSETGVIVYHVRKSPTDEEESTLRSLSDIIRLTRAETEHAIRAGVYRAIGRPTTDYILRSHPTFTARVRVSNPNIPRLISCLRDPHNQQDKYIVPTISMSPESKIFHRGICMYTDTKDWREHHDVLVRFVDPRYVHLLNFFLSPQSFVQSMTSEDDTPYVIISNETMYLATNLTEYTLRQIATRSGLKDPVVSSLENPSNSFEVPEGEYHVLDNLWKKGELTSHIVVMMERKQI